VVTAYQTLAPSEPDRARLRGLLERGEVDVVTFTSSSTVENTLEALAPDGAALLERLTVGSIGPITTETAERRGVRVTVTAAESTSDGLVRALERHFASKAQRNP
jgi:uroporphyrinogen III methyltransferase/synthase